MGYADAVGRINALGEEQDILFRRLNQGYKSVARSTRFGVIGTTASTEWLMKQRLVRYAGQSSNTYSKYAINTIGSVSASSMADITAQVIAGTVGAVNQEFVIFAQAIKHSATTPCTSTIVKSTPMRSYIIQQSCITKDNTSRGIYSKVRCP